MNDIFIQCPYCKKVVSKADYSKKMLERYGFSIADAFLPVACFHCAKSSYIQEWKQVHDIPKIQLTDDLFEI